MLAEIGYARHIGGKAATDRLIKKAGIRKGSKVLDVGAASARPPAGWPQSSNAR